MTDHFRDIAISQKLSVRAPDRNSTSISAHVRVYLLPNILAKKTLRKFFAPLRTRASLSMTVKDQLEIHPVI
jgi:hypothetical protein